MQNDVRTLLERIGQTELAYLEYSVPSNLETARSWAGLSALLDRLEGDEDIWPLIFQGGQ